MNDERILGLACCGISVPGELIIRATLGKAVISRGNYTVVVIDNTSANLSAGVLGALCRKEGNSHKIFIPAYVATSFFGHKILLKLFITYFTI